MNIDYEVLQVHDSVHRLQAGALRDEVLMVAAVQPGLDSSKLLLVVLGHGKDGVICDGVPNLLPEVLHQP